MAHYRPGSYEPRSHQNHHSRLNIPATPMAESHGMDGIGNDLLLRLASTIREHSHRPAKLILNFGDMQRTEGASDEVSNTIIYNAPGGTMTLHGAASQLTPNSARELDHPRHHPHFRKPSPAPAIIEGVEDEENGRRCFHSPEPDTPASPASGIRYIKRHHFPRPLPVRQAPVLGRSLRPVVYDQVFDGPAYASEAIETAIQDELIHSHHHPHARFCKGCHHRHRKINSDGYCPECVYFLQTAPLSHRRIVGFAPAPRVRHIPLSDEQIKERTDKISEMKRFRRTNPMPERRVSHVIRGETDNTSDEYELSSSRERCFGREKDWSGPEDWERW
ncbi:hypothetical protein QBC40DRAFT_172841 [Triangularia verruculosa]|uniref:Uncharacterized protein n=1 Tax=Triangularia verruculosa TaxID=2587418 RepID=A0AAN6XIJ3_9PEZI|nr:hypothetical protein QBC40DRAFT_172841 [Triangularia verruculosa]